MIFVDNVFGQSVCLWPSFHLVAGLGVMCDRVMTDSVRPKHRTSIEGIDGAVVMWLCAALLRDE